MLDYAEWIDRFERLPVNEVTRSVEQAEFAATETGADPITRALAHLEQLVGEWARRAGGANREIEGLVADVGRADTLLEGIEDSEVSGRFVPDWTDESLKSTA